MAATSGGRKIKRRFRKTDGTGGARRGEERRHTNSFTSSSEKKVFFLISTSVLQVGEILLSAHLMLTLLKHYIS